MIYGPGAPIAWSVVVRDGEVQFGNSDIDDVEIEVTVDWRVVLPLGRFDTRGQAERKAE